MKPLAISITIILLSALALSALVMHTEFRQEVLYDFGRQVKDVVQKSEMVDITYNSYYIAGFSPNGVYLGNHQAPLILTEFSDDLQHKRTIRLKIPAHERLHYQFTKVKTFDSTIFLFDGQSPCIYAGIIKDNVTECILKRFLFDSLYYFNAVPISHQSVLLQAISTPPRQNILCKETATSYSIADDILTRQVDGLFCTSGTLQSDRATNLAVYVYFHRNEYILLDTNLTVVGRGHTIDTFSTARVRTVEIRSSHQRKLIAPESQINHDAFVSEGKLFIVSTLYTKHDDVAVARKSSILDVYDVPTRQYCYSFYLPRHDNKSFSSIAARNTTLFAIYDHYLKKFELVADPP